MESRTFIPQTPSPVDLRNKPAPTPHALPSPQPSPLRGEGDQTNATPCNPAQRGATPCNRFRDSAKTNPPHRTASHPRLVATVLRVVAGPLRVVATHPRGAAAVVTGLRQLTQVDARLPRIAIVKNEPTAPKIAPIPRRVNHLRHSPPANCVFACLAYAGTACPRATPSASPSFPASSTRSPTATSTSSAAATQLFDELIVAVGINPEKTELFTIDERVEMIESLLQGRARRAGRAVHRADGRFRPQVGATAILRGIRDVSDLRYEFQLALANRAVGDVETVFIMTGDQYALTSSSLIRQVVSLGGDVGNAERRSCRTWWSSGLQQKQKQHLLQRRSRTRRRRNWLRRKPPFTCRAAQQLQLAS